MLLSTCADSPNDEAKFSIFITMLLLIPIHQNPAACRRCAFLQYVEYVEARVKYVAYVKNLELSNMVRGFFLSHLLSCQAAKGASAGVWFLQFCNSAITLFQTPDPFYTTSFSKWRGVIKASLAQTISLWVLVADSEAVTPLLRSMKEATTQASHLQALLTGATNEVVVPSEVRQNSHFKHKHLLTSFQLSLSMLARGDARRETAGVMPPKTKQLA